MDTRLPVLPVSLQSRASGETSSSRDYKSRPAPWETVFEVYDQMVLAAEGSGVAPRDFPESTVDPQQDAEPTIRQHSTDAAPAPEVLRAKSNPRKRRAKELQQDHPRQKDGGQWGDTTAVSKNKTRQKRRRGFQQKRRSMKENTRADDHPHVPYDVRPEGSPPVLLFDLNGTLSSHTYQRKSTGVNRIRPGIRHLRRLQERFRLGIYSSASSKTVHKVLPMLEKAAGDGPALFESPGLILTRHQTMEAPAHHREAGGNAWDTVKPLAKYFQNMHQVLLVDDEAYKACEGEEKNMVVLPRWEGNDDDKVIEWFVDALLAATKDIIQDTDLREVSTAISHSMKAKYNQIAQSEPASDVPHVEPDSQADAVAEASTRPTAAESSDEDPIEKALQGRKIEDMDAQELRVELEKALERITALEKRCSS